MSIFLFEPQYLLGVHASIFIGLLGFLWKTSEHHRACVEIYNQTKNAAEDSINSFITDVVKELASLTYNNPTINIAEGDRGGVTFEETAVSPIKSENFRSWLGQQFFEKNNHLFEFVRTDYVYKKWRFANTLFKWFLYSFAIVQFFIIVSSVCILSLDWSCKKTALVLGIALSFGMIFIGLLLWGYKERRLNEIENMRIKNERN